MPLDRWINEGDWYRQPVATGLSLTAFTFGQAPDLSVIPGIQWFTPAILFLQGLGTDVFATALEGRAPTIGFACFKRPSFRGLEDPEGDRGWNHTIWGIDQPCWEPLLGYLLSLAAFDPMTRRRLRPAMTTVSIADPLYADKHAVLGPDAPTLDLPVLGIRASDGQWTIEAQPEGLPALRRYPPDPALAGTDTPSDPRDDIDARGA